MANENEKILKARFKQKVDTTENWEKAGNNGFVPLDGEIIYYRDKKGVDGKVYCKVGDGITNINNLPFENDPIKEELEMRLAENAIQSTDYTNKTHYGYSGDDLLIIPEGTTTIANNAYQNSNYKCVVIPDSVTSIGSEAFKGCSSLTSITIPSSVTHIGSHAFWKCTSLTSITIPNSIVAISDGAFEGCSSLTSITIPDSVTSIGYAAFSNCSSLKSVTIPKSVTSIGNYAFNGIPLKTIDLTAYTTEDFPTLGSNNFNSVASDFQIKVVKGRKATLAGLTNWSNYADYIVEVPTIDYLNEQFENFKTETDAQFDTKLDKSNIVQTTGQSTTTVMSQKSITDEIDVLKGDLAYYINKEITIGTNKLDKDTMYTDGEWYYYKNGTDNKVVALQAVASYQSLTIPVEEGKTYCLWTDYAYFGTIYSYIITDDNFNIVEDGIGTRRTFNSSTPLTFIIPNGGTKLLLSATNFKTALFTNGNAFHIQINEGDTPLPYEDYHKTEKITYREISKEVEDLKREVEKKVSILKLPSRYNLIVGDTFELFYKGISNCVDSDVYDYEFSFADGNSYGKSWDRKWEYTPTSVGTLKCTITVRDNTGNVVDEGNVDFVISEIPQNPTSIKNVLCVGDSLTNTGVWCSELFRRLTKTGGTPIGYGLSNFRFIGTKQNSDGCKYEGYGGWTFDNYLSESKSNNFMNINGLFDKTDNDQHSIYEDSNGTRWKLESITSSMIKIINIYTSSVALPSSGTLTWVSGGENHSNIIYTSSEEASGNPFWDASTNSNNFTSYASKMGASSIDHCIILLGWNSSGSTELDYKTSAKAFIDGILAEYPNCKLTLLGLQVPSRNGFANNYGVAWKYYEKLQFVWKLNEWYQDIANEYTNVEFVNIAGQFDTEYNCLTMQTTPNVRNDEQINVQSNGVHPALGGYYQIADAVLRSICSRL